MAAAQAQSPLRRWKHFFHAFGAVDAAIEAGGHPRAEFRSVREGIVELLCGAEDNELAEELCQALDDAMAESLVTLRVVPVAASALTSTDLAKAVAALGQHDSARIRSLARDVVRGWRTVFEGDMARARAAMEALNKLDQDLPPENLASAISSHVPVAIGKDEKKRQVKDAPRIASNRVDPAKINAPAKSSAPLPKKSAPVVGSGRASMDQMTLKKTPAVSGNVHGDRDWSDKMETTKRKLREGYQEVEDAKRQRRIRVIEAPKMMKQRQGKKHPIMRERSRARCANSTAVRRSLMPSFHRV